jgi:DNA polymerase III subunit delta'
MPFSALRGHHPPIELLRRMLRTGRVPQAFLFSGAPGIGKHTVATAFVKALNCRCDGDDFCDECTSCRKITGRLHPDVFFLERDPEKSAVVIDQVRAMHQDIAYPPLEGRKKAVVIDHAEMLNASAANCLLKTLEEPPDDTVLILVSCAAGRMLPTIISRCQHIRFAPLAPDDIEALLIFRGHDPEEAVLAARHARGSISRAGLFLDPGYRERRVAIADALQQLGRSGDVAAALALAHNLAATKENADMVFEFMSEWYRDVLLTAEHMPGHLLCNPDMADRVRAAAAGMRPEDALHTLRTMNMIQKNAALNVDFRHELECILVR